MTEWAPATEAESAMRDALRTGDQEQYFRILAEINLLLPVPADALAGRGQLGWGTWSSGGRTHLLAFTSQHAMAACLAEHAGSAREITYGELARSWPDPDWWLAVDPGLPIEGYLPAWFVAQLASGDARVPGRRNGPPRPRLDRVESYQRAQAAAETTIQPAVRPIEPPAAGAADQIADRAPDRVADPASDRPPLPTRVPSVPRPSGAGVVVTPSPRPFATVRASAPVPQPRSAAAPPAGPTTVPTPAPAPPAKPAEAPRPPAEPGTAPVLPVRSAPAAEPKRSAAPDLIRAPAASPAPAVAPGPATARRDPDFAPANEVETNLLDAAEAGSTDSFLSTLLLTKVLVPVTPETPPSAQPGDPEFGWRTETLDDKPYLVVFTSPERLRDHISEGRRTVSVKFVQLIRHWPDEQWAFAVNPGTPVGAKLPGAQIVTLASWADEVGLTGEADDEIPVGQAPAAPVPDHAPAPAQAPVEPIVMQKVVPPVQVDYYLNRGYDRVSGFVYRANEVAHLRTPADFIAALGLGYAGSPFRKDAAELYVLYWSAHRPNLYRIPYGGQHEAGMRAMRGWVIEREPFRGNGFAPSENGDVIAQFKVDSVRLPHGAQLWRVSANGAETLVATFDADGPGWQRAEPES